jgi:hypothetical protein
MSAFDPNAFLDAQQAEVNVRRPPLPTENIASPSDGLYTGIIADVQMKSGTIEKGDRAGQPWLAAVVAIDVEVPQQVQDQLGIKLDKGTIRLSEYAMLDLTPDGKGLDNGVGKNRRQRQYRDALDMNKPGDVFSWRKAIGQPVKVKIQHEMYNGEPTERIGNIFRFSSGG